ncbi:MAG: efflux RND transporter periplasmic adaptor subunit [Pseudomonadota bacterium]
MTEAPLRTDRRAWMASGALSSLLLLAAPTLLAQGGPPGGFPAPPVRVERAQITSLAPTIPVPGSVLSRDDTRLAAEAAGRLVALAEVGDRVAAGDIIAQVDDALLRQERAQIDAERARAASQLAFLEREVSRLTKLAATNVAAERELDDTRSQRDVAARDRDVIDARLAQNQINLDRASLRAPFNGMITQRFVNPGERVAIGDQVLRVVGNERIEIISQTTVTAARYLYVGGNVTVADETGRQGVGLVRTIVPFGDSTRHMYEMRIDVPAEDWLIAQAVVLQVPVSVPEEVLAVPRDALVLRQEDTYVMRINGDDEAERVDVATGLSAGALIAVTGDLQPGDRVVVRGAERLMPGTKVRVLAAPEPLGPAAAEVSEDG